jgi:histidinol dehydrogenase
VSARADDPSDAHMGRVTVAVRGSVGALDAGALALLLGRRPADDARVRAEVARIVEDVRRHGDTALREMASAFDHVELVALEVPRERWDAALAEIQPELRGALVRAARNIDRFHRAQVPGELTVLTEPGVRLTRRFAPLGRAGVYAPGGSAAYPSSVLMGVVPARAAGVEEVVVCSPPGPSGEPPAAVLAAAALGGATRLFALGGAGAVAAMAFGTGSVPRCDAVVGPGNRWVVEAKRQLAGEIVIDAPAGPSEVLVVADLSADPARAAAELIAQAEHDPDAAVALVTPSETLLREVEEALEAQLAVAPRRGVAEAALARRGALLLARDLGEALAFAERYAPEHLALHTRSALRDAGRIRSAGTIFVGTSSSVAFGDYLTGANHVLPTAGAARSWPMLSALTFLRAYTVQEVTEEAADALASATETLALAEGLPAHAAAARLRAPARGGRAREEPALTVTVFDYGVGNLHSLAKALEAEGAVVHVTADWEEALRADALVLPGVGSFGAACEALPDDRANILSAVASGLPCLGICLGMQLLFEGSEEGEGRGLGLIPGRVRRLRAPVVPQMGWNDVEISDDPLFADTTPLVAYYANSFVCEPRHPDAAIAWSEYSGERFAAAVRRGSVWGVQFHPEKSSAAGRKLIANFLREAARCRRAPEVGSE